MEIIEKKKFTGETIALDGKHFIRCKLYQCKLIYSGGDCTFTDTEINDCQFRLDGPAQRTANLMASLGILPQPQNPSTPPQAIPSGTKGEH